MNTGIGAAAMVAAIMVASPALAQDSAGEWRQTFFRYGLQQHGPGAGIAWSF